MFSFYGFYIPEPGLLFIIILVFILGFLAGYVKRNEDKINSKKIF